MASRSKRTVVLDAKVEKGKRYQLVAAAELVKNCADAKFDESVDISVRLGIDPKQSDQNVRAAVVPPHGTGKTVKVLVIAKGEKEKEAEIAGADYAGSDEMVEKISKGWLDFDVVIATPDMMREVGKLGKLLGPKGLMPNPKSGTVTFDVARVVKECKAGRIELRNDSYGIIHASIGKASFPVEHLVANSMAVVEALQRSKPSSSKGAFVRRITLSSTMGPGVDVDLLSFEAKE